MTSRDRLLHLMKIQDKLTKEIDDAKQAYLVQYEGDALIWITDHALIRYLERVKGYVIGDELDPDKMRLHKFARHEGLDIADVRKEMLSLDEQRKAIQDDSDVIIKGEFAYSIHNLALVTVY